MFEKNMKVAYLLDIYADLLDEHVRDVMRAYYEDDLSLAEIASDVGISRQGIRHLIKKGEEHIEFYESKLGLAKRNHELTAAAETLSRIYERISKDDALKEEADALQNVILTIESRNS